MPRDAFEGSRMAPLPLSLQLTSLGTVNSVLERGRWTEGEVPALEVQGLTGGLGFPWVRGSWPASQLPHNRFTLPGHWCPAL